MNFLTSEWMVAAKESSEKGIGNIFSFGIKAISKQAEIFYENKLQLVPRYHSSYQPNPFLHQYDLMVHIWLNYYQILKQEIKILRKEKNDAVADELQQTRILYGITRSDFLFGAAELRWPSTLMPNGAVRGSFIRDPWAERRVAALSDEYIKYIVSFGGSGQGKTTVFIAVCLMIWDHYIYTAKGARCMISTVNKDKLNSVPWAYLNLLNRSTRPGISLYAGKGKTGGDWTLRRPDNKDTAGVFKGLLLGQSVNEATVTDKLTGSHGHHFIGYILDEAQSTSETPLSAATNFTQTAGDFRIMLAGNYDEDTDTLGSNAKPDQGWKEVDETTGEWMATMKNGNKAIVLHFNNDLSPGMDDELAKQFPHLPNKAKLAKNTPQPEKRNYTNINYRRFWIGWRVENLSNNKVMTSDMVSAAGADMPAHFDRLIKNVISFDSAPAEIDRNIALIGSIGYDRIHTNEKIIAPIDLVALDKTTESLKYYRESSAQLLKLISKYKIPSGAGIVDWTGRPGHAEHLHEAGFLIQRVVYNKNVPDGKTIDIHTKRVGRALHLNIQVPNDDGLTAQNICGHHVADNMISFGAWLAQQYLLAGRLKNINQELLDKAGPNNGIGQELYSREFNQKVSSKYGKRHTLVPKTDFKSKFGFSPDIQDTLFQFCLYCFLYEGVPLTPIGSSAKLPIKEEQIDSYESHNELWSNDGLEELYLL